MLLVTHAVMSSAPSGVHVVVVAEVDNAVTFFRERFGSKYKDYTLHHKKTDTGGHVFRMTVPPNDRQVEQFNLVEIEEFPKLNFTESGQTCLRCGEFVRFAHNHECV